MEDLALEIGKRLIEIRKKHNMTQQEVADSIPGLTVQMISSYETGKQKPGIENLIKLSNFFKISLDYLCTGTMNQTTLFEINNYEDVIRCILSLEKNKVFGVTSNHIFSFGISGSERYDFDLYSHNKILVNFRTNYEKLLAAKELMGDEMYNIALEGLITKHRNILIDNKE